MASHAVSPSFRKKTGWGIPYAIKVRQLRPGFVIRVEYGVGRRLLALFWDIVCATASMDVIRKGQMLLARAFISRLAEKQEWFTRATYLTISSEM